MRQFLIRFIYFLLFTGTIAVLIFLFFDYSYSRALGSANFSGANTLIAGDSHPEVAIDDQILQNTENLALSQESLYFTHYKLKPILENNRNIENLILGVSYHSFSAAYDEFIYGKMVVHVAPRYFFLLPLSEKVKLLQENYSRFPYLLRELYRTGTQEAFKSPEEMHFYGGYFNDFTRVAADSAAIERRASRHFYRDGEQLGFSDINLAYLKKLKDICHKTGTNLILVNTPVHPYYKELIPVDFREKYYSVIEELDLELIDLNDLTLEEDQYTPDGDHVSKKGAEATTSRLIWELNRKAGFSKE